VIDQLVGFIQANQGLCSIIYICICLFVAGISMQKISASTGGFDEVAIILGLILGLFLPVTLLGCICFCGYRLSEFIERRAS